jgi:hypothetical protein
MEFATSARACAFGFAAAIVLLAVLCAPPASASNEPIEPDQVMTVTLVLDRASYLSGDPATARAIVYRTPSPANYTYDWTVRDFLFRVVATASNNNSSFLYPIPLNYTGAIFFEVEVHDGGSVASDGAGATVSVAVMSLRLDRGDFTPGDTITASYSVVSHVILNPTYDYQVDDSSSTIVKSGNTNATLFSYTTPVPASEMYAFLVTAREGDNSTNARATIAQASGVLLAVTFDRSAYAPGETIRAHLALTPRGTAALPRQFEWTLTFGPFGPSPVARAITTEPQVDLLLSIPDRIGAGDLLLFATESRTGASQFVTVHIGTTNALWTTEVAGIPLFAVLLGLLFILIFVAVIGLWRRVAAGPIGPRPPPVPAEPAIPAAPPPPETPMPRGAPVAPMSIPCHHCGKPIELSTSRRPIEVMCPSCGETQLVS